MSISVRNNPTPINSRVCADCSAAAICKYKDSMEDIRNKLLSLTTEQPNEDGESFIEINLGTQFDLFLGCVYYRPSIEIQKIPEIDIPPFFHKRHELPSNEKRYRRSR